MEQDFDLLRDSKGKFMKGNKGFWLNKKRPELSKKRMNELNPMWKGNEVKYQCLHKWIRRKLGNAKICIICKSNNHIQWANKSHEYKRNLNDWISLCIKCHKAYDRGRSDIKRKWD